MIDGQRTGGAFSLVEHPLPARALGAPLHTHRNEDEYSYVLEGRVGVQLGPDVLEVGPATSSASPATSSTRSGTPATSPRACSS
jgi:mannose-6-phosphate isomerase-like protein (cupin superfamily)